MYKKYILGYLLLCIIISSLHTSTKYDNDIIIIKNFYSQNDFNKIKNFVKNTKGEVTYDKRINERKTYMYKHNNNNFDKLTNMLHNNELKDILQNSQNKTYSNNNFPIEYRIYNSSSKGMDWHIDKDMFKNVYYECVLTLSNESDSKFEYIDMYGNYNSIQTEPNTLVCVTPSTILHSVTPCNKGYREILKFVFTFSDNSPNNNFYDELKEYENGL